MFRSLESLGQHPEARVLAGVLSLDEDSMAKTPKRRKVLRSCGNCGLSYAEHLKGYACTFYRERPSRAGCRERGCPMCKAVVNGVLGPKRKKICKVTP